MADAFEDLRQHLDARGTEDPGEVARLLSKAWPGLHGGNESAMASWKVERLEEPRWEPPILSFVIERHGGTVLGSSRAEIQRWRVNLDERTAIAGGSGYRQLKRQRPALDVLPLAYEVAAAVSATADDPRLRWYDDKQIVQPVLARIVPDDGAPKQTLEGRRRRLKEALRLELAAVGWHPSGQAGRYQRIAR